MLPLEFQQPLIKGLRVWAEQILTMIGCSMGTQKFMVSVSLKWSRTTPTLSNRRLELAVMAAVMVWWEACLAVANCPFRTLSCSLGGETGWLDECKHGIRDRLYTVALHANFSVAKKEAEDMEYKLDRIKFLKNVSRWGGHIWNLATGFQRRWKDSSLWIPAVVCKNCPWPGQC